MVEIHIRRNKKDQIDSYALVGHANFGPQGQDIVCSAISALTQAAAMGIQSYLGKPIEVEADSGRFSCGVSQPDERTDAILETMVLALSEIQKQYPNKISVIET